MNTKKIVLGLSVLFSLYYAEEIRGQEFKTALSGDFVSSYVWRGFKNAGTSIQPAVSVSTRDFTLGSWASTDIASEGNKEVDFYASYGKKGWLFTVTDYWWDGEGFFQYFSNPEAGVGHSLETSLAYTFQHSVPLTLSWNTFLLGEANKSADGRNTFSTYIEASYPFKINDLNMRIIAGITPWESALYGTYGIRITNIMLNVSKEIKLSDSFSLPIYGNIISNPARQDVHFVFGVTLR